MDFKAASAELKRCTTDQEIADAAGVSLQLIRQAKLPPDNPSRRDPPANWRKVLSDLARTRAADLQKLARTLSD
jgi:hypothetical protein